MCVYKKKRYREIKKIRFASSPDLFMYLVGNAGRSELTMIDIRSRKRFSLISSLKSASLLLQFYFSQTSSIYKRLKILKIGSKMKKNHPEVCARSIAKRSELIPEYFASLYLNSDQSDITFCIENERIPAHKLILASKEYFRERLYGKYANSKQIEIRISNIGSKSFKAIMKYIYCGYLELSNLTMEEMLDILTLADTYGFSELVTVIVSHLELELSLSNVCAILEASRILHFEELTEKCLDFLDLHASEILLHRDFLGLSQVN